jgi:hypothetical protein
MRDILDKMLLIEAIETREPDFRFLMLEDNHIFIIEDDPRDQAVDAVIAAIRKLGTETDEGRALAQKIFGKQPEEVSKDEIFNKIIAPGYAGVGPFASVANRFIKSPKKMGPISVPPGTDAMDRAASIPFAKTKVAATIPKGPVRLPRSLGGTVDVDVSGSDLGVLQQVYRDLGNVFPKAQAKINDGDVMGALRQVYDRMQN